MSKKFVSYCRVSTDNQKEEKTIELQVEALNKYANKNDIEIIEWFKDDGVSGGLESRPELIRLMRFLEENKDVEGILIYKLDRLARDLYIQEGLIREFTKLNKQIVSTLEPDLDSNDPIRKAFRQFIGIVSELEKSLITLRMKNGRDSSVAKGRWHGGQIYGYDHGKNGELIINPKEAEVVRKIFRWKRRLTCSKIAKILNNEGVQTKRKNTKWHSFTVKKITQNSIYRGKLKYHGQIYKGQHEPIIK